MSNGFLKPGFPFENLCSLPLTLLNKWVSFQSIGTDSMEKQGPKLDPRPLQVIKYEIENDYMAQGKGGTVG